ncbi:MAG: T9SS type A sorting domain-containing protein [Ignavibacteriales bacterium]|nr:T9SS type A sorting domain-containing protein [Ignavibacteriales bacterium]
MKKSLLTALILLLSLTFIQAQNKSTSSNSTNKITTNDDYNYIAINQMKMWIGNNGSGSHDPNTDGSGLLWPGGEDAALNLVYADGLLWGGYVGDSLFVNGNMYRYGLQAGKILDNGLADDPSLSKYRIYKIRKDWEDLPFGETRDQYQKDYLEWPADDGAPFYDSNNDEAYTAGIDQPLFLGDEQLWCVMNDMDPSRTSYTFGTGPIGLEVQLTVCGFSTSSILQNVLFKKYRIINKSQNTINDMFFGYWSDPDLGSLGDDYVGCDTLLNLAYCYNGDGDDEGYYGMNPPAVGYVLLQGPTINGSQEDSTKINYRWVKGIKNLSMTSFVLYVPYWYSEEPGCCSLFYYNNLKGLWGEDGSPIINPLTNLSTKFAVPGDPLTGTGWTEGEGWPGGPPFGDRRMLMGSGPIAMAPGDTQEVVIAIIAAQGSDNLQSVAELKNTARTVQYFYDNYTPELVNIKYEPPLPEFYYLSQNYPNPFNPTTFINYELPINGFVSLKVFDVLGRDVATLVNEEKPAGTFQVEFTSENLSSGIYFYTLNSGAYSKTRKMIVLK